MAAQRPSHRQPHSHSQSSASTTATPPEPISGTALFETETRRRDALWDQGRGNFSTGCRELDTSVLGGSGGFERGCVVGVSAEEGSAAGAGAGAGDGQGGNGVQGSGNGKGNGKGDEAGDAALCLGLQTLARGLLRDFARAHRDDANDGANAQPHPSGETGDDKTTPKNQSKKFHAMIITTGSVAAIVSTLRAILTAQLADLRRCDGAQEGHGARHGARRDERQQQQHQRLLLQDCLERVAISRVFDVPGLWEVLGELDRLPPSQELGEDVVASARRRSLVDVQGGSEDVLDGGDTGMAGQEDHGDARDQGDAMEIERTFCPARNEQAGNDAPERQSGQAEQGIHNRPADVSDDEEASSPLSSPPSGLSDTPPWHVTEMVQQATSPHQQRTPPGLRDEIQDSEDEELSSPPESLGSAPRLQVFEPTGEAMAIEGLERHDDLRSSQPENESDPDIATNTLNDAEVRPDTTAASHTSPEAHTATTSLNSNTSETEATVPDMILITHMSTLISSLFHQREKATAHHMLHLLSTHLRYISRSPDHGYPLIMVLNSTTSTTSNQESQPGATPRPNRPLDPTLRSIFNPAPLQASRLGAIYEYNTPCSRRNKPSFGLVFSQMLDVHLLCTRIPKTQADAEALFAAASTGARKRVRYAWVVEVLLDEMGIWEGRDKVVDGRPRRSREQRWGAVEFRREGPELRVVNAFDK
ncbi:hypothetical protein BD289DRAFT_457399 [Coniella lustricola]|uniref:Uncharacterized protein n=1 Tax=Coniella lustricola TaxID=2025994 RepID=A0A2T2ZS17_9PEZI|nr:hypothetical protein BD289DRAFT_457399 [Coniella lustricola]